VALPPAQLRILGRGWWGAPRPRRSLEGGHALLGG
jgi:hypothetical protein